MRKILWVFLMFCSQASVAENGPAAVSEAVITSVVVPGGPPPAAPPPIRPWLCAAGCTPESMMKGHEEYLNQAGQKPAPGKRSIAYTDASGNISSKEIDEEK